MPRSPSRKTKETYAREYAARAQRSRALGISYARARSLRETFPLSPKAKARVVRVYGRQRLTEIHTKYAVTRAHIARAQAGRGEKLSKARQRAVRTIKDLPNMPNPVRALGDFYKAVGMDPGTLPTSGTSHIGRDVGSSEDGSGPDYGTPPDFGAPDYIPSGYSEGEPMELSPEDYEEYEDDIYDWYDDMVDDFEMYDYGEYMG